MLGANSDSAYAIPILLRFTMAFPSLRIILFTFGVFQSTLGECDSKLGVFKNTVDHSVILHSAPRRFTGAYRRDFVSNL